MQQSLVDQNSIFHYNLVFVHNNIWHNILHVQMIMHVTDQINMETGCSQDYWWVQIFTHWQFKAFPNYYYYLQACEDEDG
jgi:hypothetical protein